MDRETPELANRILCFAKSRNGLLLFFLVFALLAFVAGRPGERPERPVTVDELAEVMPELYDARESVLISRDPSRLQGVETNGRMLRRLTLRNAALKDGRIVSCSLPEITAENVVFENFVFDRVSMEKGAFKNVRFVNCTFSRTQLTEMSFSGCLFQGGTMSGRSGNPARPEFDRIRFEDTVFDAVAFTDFFTIGNTTGDVTFRNITAVEGGNWGGWALLHGMETMRAAFEGCATDGVGLVYLIDEASALFTDCTFVNSSFNGGGQSAMVFENCRFQGRERNGIRSDGAVTLRSCTLEAGFSVDGRAALTLDDTELP
jgi:uncharacterized protein YjbI with pentapeptide repeats